MATKHSQSQTALLRSSPDPLYRQLAARLEAGVRSGELRPGQRLGSEAELAAQFRISRITVRQAIEELVRQQLLVRKQGKGTFVAQPAVRHDLRRLHGFLGSLFSQAPDASIDQICFELRAAPQQVGAAMALDEEGRALALERLYLIGGKPVAFAEDWLTPEIASLSRAKAALISTEDMLRQSGIVIGHAEIAIHARPAGAKLGRLLQVSPRAPILSLHRTAFGIDGTVKEIGSLAFCSEKYEFFASTRGLQPSEPLFNIRNVAERA